MSSAALLVPMAAVPESRIESGATGAALQATAHVNFKIVIPRELYLHVEGASGRDLQTVAIMSNGRNVWLTASVRGPQAAGSAAAHGNIMLSAAGRKVIAQNTACTLGGPRNDRESAGASQLLCTASMP